MTAGRSWRCCQLRAAIGLDLSVSVPGNHSLQVSGNLYRHTNGHGQAVHSGFVLITEEVAPMIDPAMTCTADWLRDEIKKRFDVSVKYVVYTHGHADHVSGGQVFQEDVALQCTDVCESRSAPYNDYLDFYLPRLDRDTGLGRTARDQLYRNVKFSDEVKTWIGSGAPHQP